MLDGAACAASLAESLVLAGREDLEAQYLRWRCSPKLCGPVQRFSPRRVGEVVIKSDPLLSRAVVDRVPTLTFA